MKSVFIQSKDTLGQHIQPDFLKQNFIERLRQFEQTNQLPQQLIYLEILNNSMYSQFSDDPEKISAQLDLTQNYNMEDYSISALVDIESSKVIMKNKFIIQGDLQLLNIFSIFEPLGNQQDITFYKLIKTTELSVANSSVAVYRVQSSKCTSGFAPINIQNTISKQQFKDCFDIILIDQIDSKIEFGISLITNMLGSVFYTPKIDMKRKQLSDDLTVLHTNKIFTLMEVNQLRETDKVTDVDFLCSNTNGNGSGIWVNDALGAELRGLQQVIQLFQQQK